MNPLTSLLHLVGAGATAYLLAVTLRDPQTRPMMLAGLQLAESGSVPLLEALRDRASREGDTWLADRLQRHADDERRHGRLFARALERLGKQVVPLAERQRQQAARQNQRDPFFSSYFEGYTRDDLAPERLDWPVFLASTHILEFDACKNFARLARVLPEQEPRDRQLRQALLSIASDEARHAAYLEAALHRRLPAREVELLLADWRERQVRATLAMAGQFFQQRDRRRSLVQDGVPSLDEPELATPAAAKPPTMAHATA